MGRRGRGAEDPEAVDSIDQVDQVDGLIERHLTDGTAETPAGAEELVASIRRVHALSDEPLPAESRQRHLRRIRSHEVAGAGSRRGPVWDGAKRGGAQGRAKGGSGLRRRFVVVAAASLAVLMLTAGSAVGLAQGADPDDVLYGVKRASEQAWLAMPRGSERAAEVHLALAERRLEEAQRAPAHAERLVTDSIRNADVAAEELPADAVENLLRLLGDGPDRLPDNASPAARAALHRNCVRIAGKHDLGPERCGPEPEWAHPGRGRGMGEGAHPGRGRGLDRDDHPGQGRGPDSEGHPGRGPGLDRDDHPGQGRGPDGEGHPGRGPGLDREDHPGRGAGPRGSDDAIGPRGWGPGGRPDGAVGPPPGTPGHERWDPDADPGDVEELEAPDDPADD